MTTITSNTNLDGATLQSRIEQYFAQAVLSYNPSTPNWFISFSYQQPTPIGIAIGAQVTVTFAQSIDPLTNQQSTVIDSVFIGPGVGTPGPGFTIGALPTGNASNFANHFGGSGAIISTGGVGVGVSLGDGPSDFLSALGQIDNYAVTAGIPGTSISYGILAYERNNLHTDSLSSVAQALSATYLSIATSADSWSVDALGNPQEPIGYYQQAGTISTPSTQPLQWDQNTASGLTNVIMPTADGGTTELSFDANISLAFPVEIVERDSTGEVQGQSNILNSGTIVSTDHTLGTPGTWTTTVQREFDHGGEVTGTQIGSIFGSSLGQAIAGDNIFAQIGAGAGLSAVLATVGGSIGHYFDDTSTTNDGLQQGAFDALGAFSANLAGALQGQAIGALSGFLTGELADALHLGNGVGSGLLRSVSGSVTSTVLNNVANNTPDIFSGLQGSVTTGVGSFLGGYLAHQIVTPVNMGGSIAGSIGGSIGTSIGLAISGSATYIGSLGGQILTAFSLASAIGTASSVIGGILLPGIGAFIGTLIGTWLGNVVGGNAPHGSGRLSFVFDEATQTFTHTPVSIDDSAQFAQKPAAIADATVPILNSFIAAIGGRVMNGAAVQAFLWSKNNTNSGVVFDRIRVFDRETALDSQMTPYVNAHGQLWTPEQGTNNNGAPSANIATDWNGQTNAENVIGALVIGLLRELEIDGGNLYVKRAIANDNTPWSQDRAAAV